MRTKPRAHTACAHSHVILVTKHFKVSPWPGDLLLLVWNNQAPLVVPWSQRVSEFSQILGAGGGLGVFCGWGNSQLRRRALCAAADLASVLWCWFLAAFTEASHCFF